MELSPSSSGYCNCTVLYGLAEGGVVGEEERRQRVQPTATIYRGPQQSLGLAQASARVPMNSNTVVMPKYEYESSVVTSIIASLA